MGFEGDVATTGSGTGVGTGTGAGTTTGTGVGKGVEDLRGGFGSGVWLDRFSN